MVENAIGPTALSEKFRGRLNSALGLQEQINPTAWWSIDYHIDWLFAALRCHELGDRWSDTEQTWIEPNLGHYTYRIEDIDLVLCDGNRVVLIEAKAYGAWGAEQIRRKASRLSRLAEIGAKQGIEFFFVLMSPRPPQKLSYDGWHASWLKNGKPVWIELEAPTKRGLLINQSDQEGNPDGDGCFARIMRNSATPAEER